jgi:hypothetical protein
VTTLALMQDKEAQLVQDLSAQSSLSHTFLPQLLIVGGSLFAVILFAVVWAVFIRRKSPRRRRRHHWRTHSPAIVNGSGSDSAPEPGRRRRRSRSNERPRNPTLAETRGLPPLRDQEPKPPPSY